MMRLLVLLCNALLVASASSQISVCGSCEQNTATICIVSSAQITAVEGGCHGQSLSFTATVQPFQTPAVILFIKRPGLVLNQISVQINGNGAAIALSIIPQAGGSLASLSGINQSGGNGELWIGDVFVNGPVGPNPIAASSVNLIHATGSITSSIDSLGSPPNGQGQPGAIGTIQSTAGSILGDVSSRQRIEEVIADVGTIGTPSQPVTIQGLGDLFRAYPRTCLSRMMEQPRWRKPWKGMVDFS